MKGHHFAEDLLSESKLKKADSARVSEEHEEEKDEWSPEDLTRERLRSAGVVQ
jgi:hypothetical protein